MGSDTPNQDESKTDARVRTFTFNAAVPPGEPFPRYFHYSLSRHGKQASRLTRVVGTFPRIDLQTLPPPPISFAHRVEAGAGDQTVTEARCCIYCGATKYATAGERLPTHEHIIPEGIGGNLLVNNASCRICADKIGRFENWVQLHQFNLARTSLGIRGKKKGLKSKPMRESQRSTKLWTALSLGKSPSRKCPRACSYQCWSNPAAYALERHHNMELQSCGYTKLNETMTSHVGK